MKLPKFFRSLMYFSIPVFVVSMILVIILMLIFGEDLSALETTVVNLVGGVVVISFLTMSGSIIANPLVRFIENTILRFIGIPSTAKVIDLYYVESGTQRGRKLIEAIRIKLEVRNPDGGSFIAVAEDNTSMAYQLSQGQTVPVKFEPRTKEVALDLPKKPKMKRRKDF